jgi:translation initiation factor eIF-2B subunit epsilon
MKVTPVYTPAAHDVGDVMRELDVKQLIQSDFILVSGNVVSNMKLDKVLLEHRLRFICLFKFIGFLFN